MKSGAQNSLYALLKKVEARAVFSDFLRAAIWAATFAGFLFILFGAIDYYYPLAYKTRLATAGSIILLAIAWVTFETIRRARKRGAMWAAALVEQRAATLDNQLFTIAECEFGGTNVPAYLRARIEDSLSRRLESIRPSRVVRLSPGRAAWLSLFSALAICALIFCLSPQVMRDEFRRLLLFERYEKNATDRADISQTRAPQNGDVVEELRVVLTPPAYTKQSTIVQINEGNIAALIGTRADLTIKVDREMSAALFSMGGAAAKAMEREGEFSYHASFVVKEDSNFQISLAGLAEPNWKWEAVYGIRVVKDNPPEVHITRPASDLLFTATARPESLFVDIAASDDYGVALVKLKYIKTTGEGDASRFESGELNIARAPDSAAGQTRGAARLDLTEIGAGPGTSLVFHAEAMDRNNVTGPGVGYSENIIVQVAGPEPLKISLDDIRPDEALKYLTSQRMILIKTEKLARERTRLPAGDFISRSQGIAVEQRRLRESFNQFSEIESANDQATDAAPADESNQESEAARLRSAELPDIPAGASETAREMILALRAMWKAEGALSAADTALAIGFEKEALAHLKAAQKGVRYFTRVLARSKPVDLKRRYLGALDEIRSRLERAARKQESEFDKQLRSATALVYQAARLLAGERRGDTSRNQRLEAARQKIDQASDHLLGIRGEGANMIIESASKLKIVARMLGEPNASQHQDAFGLLAQVASEMAAAIGRDERRGLSPPTEGLPPAARARAASYFKLLANPSN